nr:hypothetical protein Iba_chr09cCG5530 [Ipomoea batatas]
MHGAVSLVNLHLALECFKKGSIKKYMSGLVFPLMISASLIVEKLHSELKWPAVRGCVCCIAAQLHPGKVKTNDNRGGNNGKQMASLINATTSTDSFFMTFGHGSPPKASGVTGTVQEFHPIQYCKY